MARYVKIAAVQFASRIDREAPEAYDTVVGETRDTLDSLKGYGLDLVVFCEGVEATAQRPDQAEAADEPGPLLRAYAEFAQTEGCHVAGSIKLREGDGVHNSIAFVGP